MEFNHGDDGYIFCSAIKKWIYKKFYCRINIFLCLYI
jgi:hypothetical protein